MKKIITLVFLSVLFIQGNSQIIRSSIGLGTAPNRVKIYIRPDLAIPNVLGTTLQFDIAIDKDILPIPNLTIKTNGVGMPTWTQIPNFIEPGTDFRHYQLIANAPGTWSLNLAALQEFEVMEIEFTDGPAVATDVYSMTLGICCGLPFGGGSTIQSLFNATVGAFSSQENNLYYTRPGTTVLNNPSYTGPLESWARISNVLLPVKFKDFNAFKEGGAAKLAWEVEGETVTTDRYEVQSSSNCSDFTTVATVPANVKPNGSNSYTLSNVKLNSTNTTCFRIMQVDKDGRTSISPTRAINLSGKSGVVSVYPNPAVDVVKVTVDQEKAASVNISVSGANGQNVLNQKFSAVAGVNVFPINLSKLASGNYNFKITTGTKTEVIPVVKK